MCIKNPQNLFIFICLKCNEDVSLFGLIGGAMESCFTRYLQLVRFSIDFACLQISPFETVTLYAASAHSPR